MKVWCHRYTLAPVKKSLRPRQGALLKIEWAVHQTGYSDLHPWPEFGEEPLEAHLRSLADMKFTRLAEISLEYNYADREFRLGKRNAFLGLILPRTHRLVMSRAELTAANLRQWKDEGFTHVKVKMGRDLEAETAALANLGTDHGLHWRLDFNGRMNAADFAAWWLGLNPELKRLIDYVEDPTAEGEVECQGPWANDWHQQSRARVRILKPARDGLNELVNYDRVIFSHVLDHPFGQASAAWAAARFYSQRPKLTEVCGLAGVDFYEPNEFSRVWHCPGPRLRPTPGLGFGFDDILAALSWERLA